MNRIKRINRSIVASFRGRSAVARLIPQSWPFVDTASGACLDSEHRSAERKINARADGKKENRIKRKAALLGGDRDSASEGLFRGTGRHRNQRIVPPPWY